MKLLCVLHQRTCVDLTLAKPTVIVLCNCCICSMICAGQHDEYGKQVTTGERVETTEMGRERLSQHGEIGEGLVVNAPAISSKQNLWGLFPTMHTKVSCSRTQIREG